MNTDEVRLRHDFRPGDLGAVLCLHGPEFLARHGFGLRFEGYVAAGLGKFALEYQADRDRMWIAVDGLGNVLGTLTIAHASIEEAQLRWFVVHPSAQGRGIGKALLKEAIAFARSCGYASLFLWTIDDLKAALHLYRREGFELAEEKTNSDWANRTVTEQRYVLAF